MVMQKDALSTLDYGRRSGFNRKCVLHWCEGTGNTNTQGCCGAEPWQDLDMALDALQVLSPSMTESMTLSIYCLLFWASQHLIVSFTQGSRKEDP